MSARPWQLALAGIALAYGVVLPAEWSDLLQPRPDDESAPEIAPATCRADKPRVAPCLGASYG